MNGKRKKFSEEVGRIVVVVAVVVAVAVVIVV